MSLRGGLKPGSFTARFGNDAIMASSPVRYLGILLDYKKKFWYHINDLATKSEEMYSRVRGVVSADWGTNQWAATVIYRSVFLPRLSYLVCVWGEAINTAKARKKLGSAQRKPLLAICNAYRTVSTDALQVIAGALPLDLELKYCIQRKRCKEKVINEEVFRQELELILEEWQKSWSCSEKGRWTCEFFPDVRERIGRRLPLDHYVTQLLSGHGDFRCKLHGFKLCDTPLCLSCGKNETARHVIFECPDYNIPRSRLERAVVRCVYRWPCNVGDLVGNITCYEALRKFAKEALLLKKEIRDMQE